MTLASALFDSWMLRRRPKRTRRENLKAAFVEGFNMGHAEGYAERGQQVPPGHIKPTPTKPHSYPRHITMGGELKFHPVQEEPDSYDPEAPEAPTYDTSSKARQPTMRQLYAMAAMQGLLAGKHDLRTTDPEVFAKAAFNIADAMVKYEEKP